MTYSTKQRIALKKMLIDEPNRCFTIELYQLCQFNAIKISKTTIYRTLELLVEDGEIIRFSPRNQEGSTYQYHQTPHLHARCTQCNAILHVNDDCFSDIRNYFLQTYHFTIDTSHTTLNGICKRCNEENTHE